MFFLLVALGSFVLWRSLSEGEEKPFTASLVQTLKPTPKKPAALFSREAQPNEQAKLDTLFGEHGKRRTISKEEILVAEGETVITEGYEAAPGEFVYSSLCPRIDLSEGGAQVVRLEVVTYKITVGGGYDVLQEFSMDADPKTIYERGLFTDERVHRLNLRAKIDEPSSKIRMSAFGESSEMKKAVTAEGAKE